MWYWRSKICFSSHGGTEALETTWVSTLYIFSCMTKVLSPHSCWLLITLTCSRLQAQELVRNWNCSSHLSATSWNVLFGAVLFGWLVGWDFVLGCVVVDWNRVKSGKNNGSVVTSCRKQAQVEVAFQAGIITPKRQVERKLLLRWVGAHCEARFAQTTLLCR